MRSCLLSTFMLVLLISCGKNNSKPGTNVEIYLLSSYQLVPNKCQVDTTQAVLEHAPFINNDEILQYSETTYQYKLTAGALDKIKHLAGRTPFAITVDKKAIYYGFYMPFILSSTCFNSITLAESVDQSSSITMNLGYPYSQAPGSTQIDDQRNNAALIATLARQGKLM